MIQVCKNIVNRCHLLNLQHIDGIFHSFYIIQWQVKMPLQQYLQANSPFLVKYFS